MSVFEAVGARAAGHAHRRGAGAHRTERLPDRRQLRRHVHGQHHGVGVRSARHGAARVGLARRRSTPPRRPGRRVRARRWSGLLETGHPAPADHDQGGVRERHRRHHGPRRFDQRRAPPAGHRQRGPGRADPRRLRPDRPAGSAHRRHQAPRPLPHGRRRPGRWRSGGDARPARSRAAARRLPDGHRTHHGREPGGARPPAPRRRR